MLHNPRRKTLKDKSRFQKWRETTVSEKKKFFAQEYILRGTEGHDPLFKLGPLYHRILAQFCSVYSPHQALAIDESMVAWHGNLSFRVYSPDKPVKYGLKAYALCDAENAYCLKFKLYTGKTVGSSIIEWHHIWLGYGPSTKPLWKGTQIILW